jgi:hypothetical protein
MKTEAKGATRWLVGSPCSKATHYESRWRFATPSFVLYFQKILTPFDVQKIPKAQQKLKAKNYDSAELKLKQR